MPKRGENIFKRKDGRWEARYIKGYELSGKTIYGFCYGKTYKEAKEKAAIEKAALIGHESIVTGGNRPFSYYCYEWLEIQRSSVKESTYVKYDTVLKKHIIPRLGRYCSSTINTLLMEKFRAELLGKGLSPKTVKDVLAIMHAIVKYAMKQHPGEFPAVEIRYPKENGKEMRVLTIEEQQKLVDYLRQDMDECKFGILLALLTGIRIGELCALQWDNISLGDRTIQIKSTMQRLKSLDGETDRKTKILIGEPKSGKSFRTIPMSDSAVWLCMEKYPQCGGVYVMTGTEKYMEPRTAQRKLEKYTRECGLDGVHFHTLRHTFATRCVEVGFELKSLSEILGHASTSVTLNRYVHASLEMKRDNMNKLASVGL